MEPTALAILVEIAEILKTKHPSKPTFKTFKKEPKILIQVLKQMPQEIPRTYAKAYTEAIMYTNIKHCLWIQCI